MEWFAPEIGEVLFEENNAGGTIAGMITGFFGREAKESFRLLI